MTFNGRLVQRHQGRVVHQEVVLGIVECVILLTPEGNRDAQLPPDLVDRQGRVLRPPTRSVDG